jgi:predicted dehydrogenase
MAKTKSRCIRVGIIGQGRSGYSIHADHLRRDSRYQIVAVVDPLAERRQQAEQEFGAQTYASHREMLGRKDLDLVVNAAPSCLHVPITLEFLEAGYNVLCEKPLARRVADVDRLIEAARKAGRLLAIFQQSRFAPYFEQVRKVIDSGVLGRIVMIKIAWNGFSRRWDWQTLQEYDGGNLLNTGPHPLDHALQLFGEGMPEVRCIMDRTNTFGDAEDHVKLLMTGKDRPTIDLEVSSCAAYSPYNYLVYGTLGGLTASQSEVNWKYYNAARASTRQLIREPLPGRQYCSERLSWVEKKWTIPKSKANLFPYMARQFYTHLCATLTEDAPLVITPEHVRRQVAVIEECHRQNPLPRLRTTAPLRA